MGGVCGTYGKERTAQRLLKGKPKERYHLEGLDVGQITIPKCILNKSDLIA